MGELHIIDTGKWSVEQALLSVMKEHENVTAVYMVCRFGKDASWVSVCGGDLSMGGLFTSAEMLRERGLRHLIDVNADVPNG